MKKIIPIIMAALLVCFVGALAIAAETEQAAWYELTGDDFGADILTIRLDSNPSTGFDWTFDISDPELIELLTMEYVPDTYDDIICGGGGTWVASFRNFSGKIGSVTVTFEYARPWEDRAIEERVLHMEIGTSGEIIVKEAPEGLETAEDEDYE